jgi:LPXTG-site transpeptidase (sortase) family protein
MPGERGNVAIAGHRVGRGSPFLDLDELAAGDPLVVETREAWYVYRVLDGGTGIPGREIVRPADVEVISPVPGGPADAAPEGAYLTLTTCHPEYSTRQRLVVHAVLTDEGALKTDEPDGPAVLGKG